MENEWVVSQGADSHVAVLQAPDGLMDSVQPNIVLEIDVKGVKKQAPLEIESESIVDIERRFPQDAVKIHRADGKPIAAAELPKLLASDRCVLVSTDGQDVDAKYLEIVRPEALIVVAPMALPQISIGVPSIAPAPIPAPAPLPAAK